MMNLYHANANFTMMLLT